MKATIFLGLNLISLAAFCQPGNKAYESQKQYGEYQRLHEATMRAWKVPEHNFSASSSYKSPSSGSTTSSGSSSSSGSRTMAGAPMINSTPDYFNWGGQDRYNRQLAAGARMKEKESARKVLLDNDMAKFRKILETTSIPKDAAHYDQLYMLGYGNMIDMTAVQLVIGFSKEEYSNILNGVSSSSRDAYSGSTKALCQGDCSETLTWTNGKNTYTGNTRNGMPDGNGKMRTENGDVYTGTFRKGIPEGSDMIINVANGDMYYGGFGNQQFNGTGRYVAKDGTFDEGTFKDNVMISGTKVWKTYTNAGTWNKSGPTGIHTYTYPNGKIETADYASGKAVWTTIAPGNLDTTKLRVFPAGTVFSAPAPNGTKPYVGRVTYDDGVFYEGKMDKMGNFTEGTLDYTKDVVFKGEFKNNKMHRGAYKLQWGYFIGELEPAGVNFTVGRLMDNKGVITDRFFGPKNTKNGYGRVRYPDGRVMETINKDDKEIGPMIYLRDNGELFSGMVYREGYQMFGMMKDTLGKSSAMAMTNEGEWIPLPASETIKAQKASKDATAEIVKGRADYLAALKWNPAIKL